MSDEIEAKLYDVSGKEVVLPICEKCNKEKNIIMGKDAVQYFCLCLPTAKFVSRPLDERQLEIMKNNPIFKDNHYIQINEEEDENRPEHS